MCRTEQIEKEVSRTWEPIQSAVTLPRIQPINFHRYLPDILRNVCQSSHSVDFRPIPKKAQILKDFPVLKARKKGQNGKVKSTTGYIWLDTDGLAILANKYVIKSCHTLDNLSYGHQTGNFNHLYNPWMASLFAGAKSPLEARLAESPLHHKDVLYVNGDPAYIRQHQAVANVYVMVDCQDRPYLFLSRPYDSCEEFPWLHSMFRYVRAVCRKYGLGLCVDSQYWDTVFEHEGDGAKSIRNNNCRRADLRTPAFRLFGGTLFPSYQDGSLSCAQTAGNHAVWEGSGLVVVEPTLESLEGAHWPHIDSYSVDMMDAEDDSYYCEDCHRTLYDGDLCTWNGDIYCSSCYSSHAFQCDGCYQECDREDNRYEVGHREYCSGCYSDRFTYCEHCDSDEPNERVHCVGPHNEPVCEDCASQCEHCQEWELSDNVKESEDGCTYCETCYDELFQECDNCGEEYAIDSLTENGRFVHCAECHDLLLAEARANFGPDATVERTHFLPGQQCMEFDTVSDPPFAVETLDTPEVRTFTINVRIMPKVGYGPCVQVVRVWSDGEENRIDEWFTIEGAMCQAEEFCENSDIVVETYHSVPAGLQRYASMARGMPWTVQSGSRHHLYVNGRMIGTFETKNDAQHFLSWSDNRARFGVVYESLWDIAHSFCDPTWRHCAEAVCA